MSYPAIAAQLRSFLAKPDLTQAHRNEALRLLREAEGGPLTHDQERILAKLSPRAAAPVHVEGSSLVLDSSMTEAQARARMREMQHNGTAPQGAPFDPARTDPSAFRAANILGGGSPMPNPFSPSAAPRVIADQAAEQGRQAPNVIVQPTPNPLKPTTADDVKRLPIPPAPARDVRMPPLPAPLPPRSMPGSAPNPPYKQATPSPEQTVPPVVAPAAKPTGFEYSRPKEGK